MFCFKKILGMLLLKFLVAVDACLLYFPEEGLDRFPFDIFVATLGLADFPFQIADQRFV